MSKKPLSLSKALGEIFDVSNMSAGYKRGMILSVAPSTVASILKNPGIKPLLVDFQFRGSQFIIYVSNAILQHEINLYRHRVRDRLNNRVKEAIIKEVRVYVTSKKQR